MEVIKSNSKCVLVRVCELDESGNEIKSTGLYLVFEIPSWNLIMRSQSKEEAEKCYNENSKEQLPNEGEDSLPNEEAKRALEDTQEASTKHRLSDEDNTS